jgi:CBS domain-containing protein
VKGEPVRIAKLLEEKGTEVFTLGPTATVGEAVTALADHGIGALVVSGDGKKIAGIVSERDVVRALAEDREGLLSRPVSEIMSSEVSTCSPGDDTDMLMAAMTKGRFRHVPVVRNGELAGLVSIGDIVKSRIGELEKDRKELVDYINAR